MNEAAARLVLLLRAHENLGDSALWSAADRDWATRAAAQVEGENASDDAFVARRAALAIERLGTRDKQIERLLASVAWPVWLGWAVPLLALIAGFAVDAIGAGRQVNLLAPPLLALLAWNLIVYAVMALRFVAGLFGGRGRSLGPVRQALARIAHITGSVPRRAGKAAVQFVADWMRASGRLIAARLGRVLHAAAVAFAIGALAGLYLRGLAFEYRAGWESTFLSAEHVRLLLDAVLGPASSITRIGLPDVAGTEALRFAASGGVNAAPWLHLWAVTITLFVLLPRALFAAFARWREAQLAARFPLPLDEPYFRALIRTLRQEPVLARIAAYGAQLAAQATLNLNSLLAEVLGARASISAAPLTAYGAEDDAGFSALAGNATLLLPLFAMSATPEPENHGVFIDRLRAAAANTAQVVVLVDESAFRRQFDGTPRIDERRALWREFAAARGLPIVFADLAQAAAQEAVRDALAAALGTPAST